jgi:hypothetical protein
MRIRAVAVGIGVVLVVGACTHDGGGSAGSAGGARSAESSVDSGVAGAAAKPAQKGTASGGLADDLVLGRAEIRTAQMTVAIRHGQSVAAKADTAEAIAARVGGETDSDDRTSGKYPSATLVLRVPPDTLSATLHDLSQLGGERSRELSTQDVTAKVADVSSRVTSARESIARLRVLYQHATKVADVIAIESELAGRESDLESLEAQQRALDAQTSMATVTLSLVSAAPVVKPAVHHSRSGFLGGLETGWDAFAGAAAWVATAVGALLPFAVLLAALAVVARFAWPRLWPRLRSTRPAPQDNA